MSCPSLRLEAVSYRYDGGPAIFHDVSIHLTPGWYGVAGPNGSGKTTLLGLLSGELEPAGGRVHRHVGVVCTCAQRVEQLDSDVRAFADSWDRSAQRLRSRLDLDERTLQRWRSLSPGERKRWQVAAALWREPAMLLLDEPSNHLDREARELLLQALASFSGIGVLVSHDRAMLEALAPRTIWVEDAAARLLQGSYGAARDQREAERRRLVSEHQQHRNAEERARRQLAEQQRERARADRAGRVCARMKSRHDHDARSAGAKARTAKAAATVSRKAAVLGSRLERAQAAADASRLAKRRGTSIQYDGVVAPKPHLAVLDGVSIYAGDAPLLHDLRLTLHREDRVHLCGPNGAGKSTLLEALKDAIDAPSERFLHLPQEIDEASAQRLAADLRSSAPEARGRWLQLAAALGADPDALLTTARLSPGEARKLSLARGLSEQVWCLLLDEPTNHFDVTTIERLEAALVDYRGALVLVSHDEQLAARCTTSTWLVQAGRVRVDPDTDTPA